MNREFYKRFLKAFFPNPNDLEILQKVIYRGCIFAKALGLLLARVLMWVTFPISIPLFVFLVKKSSSRNDNGLFEGR